MPRQRRGAVAPARSAPIRPTAAPARPNVAPPNQNRSSSTVAHPPAKTAQGQPPAQQGQSSGLFGQMASTAAGVAVGSSIGHAIGGFFGGGSSGGPAESQGADTSVATQSTDSGYQSNWGARSCETDAKAFTTCLDDNQGNMQICSWYLDQLVSYQAFAGHDIRKTDADIRCQSQKACQSAASQY